MALARPDALTPYGGGPRSSRSRGYVTVREPACGFFVAGSSIEDLNGVYGPIRLSSVPFHRRPQLAYKNDHSGWLMVLSFAPEDQPRGPDESSDSDEQSRELKRREWCFVDLLGRERFAHKGDTIIPGAGHRWWHLHRRQTAFGTPAREVEELVWYECKEDPYETAAEDEEEMSFRCRAPEMSRPTGAAVVGQVKPEDNEDELPWQVIAVLDAEVLQDLRRGYRYYRRQIDAALEGAGLPKPSPTSIEGCCSEPGRWLFRVAAPEGVDVRASPSALAWRRGHYSLGEYFCGAERQGAWLRLASPSASGSHAPRTVDSAASEKWVLAEDKKGRKLVEVVDEVNSACLSMQQDGGLEADTFDRPFEPRLQAPHDANPQEEEEPAENAAEDVEKMRQQEALELAPVAQSRPLAAGTAVLLHSLHDPNLDGQEAVVLSSCEDGASFVVRLAKKGSTATVPGANLRPTLKGLEDAGQRAAAVLGLDLADLGIAGGGPRPSSAAARDRLGAGLRAAQRDAVGDREAWGRAERAHEELEALLQDSLPAEPDQGCPHRADAGVLPPHASVEAGALGARAASFARDARCATSLATVERGAAGLREVLADEHKRLVLASGVAWPPRAAELGSVAPEAGDGLRLRLSLVWALLRCRRGEEALREAVAAAGMHPGAAAAHLWVGRCLLMQARPQKEAIDAMTKAVDAGPESGADAAWGHAGSVVRLRALQRSDRHRLSAEDAYAYGDFELAVKRFGLALETLPLDDKCGRATLLVSRAACHRRARALPKAVQDCEAALALLPRFGRALFRRAACLLEAGRPAEAISGFETLLRLDRNWPNLCEWLVRAHAQLRRVDRGGGHDADEGLGVDPVIRQGTDYYAVLGVPTDATEKQLKRAYRLMSLKYHPDKQGGSTRSFQLIATAYETLSQPDKRRAYDEGADVKHRANMDSDSESEREERSLREEIERKYFPERFKFWPFGDPFVEKRKLQARRRRQAGQPRWPRADEL